MSTGKFIVFEGGDGSGKTTQAALCAERLLTPHASVFLTQQPWDGRYVDVEWRQSGAGLRERIFARAPGASTEELSLLFAADRRAHMQIAVEPWLASGRSVVCDRYIPSSYAYQATGRGRGDPICRLLREANRGLRVPDAIVILQVPSVEAIRRVRMAGKHDWFDAAGTAEVERRALTYCEMSELYPEARKVLRFVDGVGSVEEVAERVRTALGTIDFGGAR